MTTGDDEHADPFDHPVMSDILNRLRPDGSNQTQLAAETFLHAAEGYDNAAKEAADRDKAAFYEEQASYARKEAASLLNFLDEMEEITDEQQ